MFKNLNLFRIQKNSGLTSAMLIEALKKSQFSECGSSDMKSEGWAPPRPGEELVHQVNGEFLLMLCTEKKLLPSSVIKKIATEKALEIEEQQGFAMGRKAFKELKERVADELVSKAFTTLKKTSVWMSPASGWLAIDTSSASRADDVIKHLLKCLPSLQIEALRVNEQPVEMMTYWLMSEEDDPVPDFTVDQETELTATNQSKARLRLSKESIDSSDVKKHLALGKKCTKMALTWNSKISFMLASTLQISKLKALDVLNDPGESKKDEAERFDSDFAMMTGEVTQLLGSLVTAFGGFEKLAKAA